MPYHVRMAELWLEQRRRDLTESEQTEMIHCLAANAKYCWDLVALYNMSYAAYAAGDMNWLHDICARIDAIEDKQVNVKKPGSKPGT